MEVVKAYERNMWGVWFDYRAETEKDVKRFYLDDLRWIHSNEQSEICIGFSDLVESDVKYTIDKILDYSKLNKVAKVFWFIFETSKPATLQKTLVDRGFTEGQPYPIMGLELNNLQEESDDRGLMIKPVTDEAELKTWRDILVAAWGSQYFDYFDYVYRTEAKLGFSDELPFRKYIGYMDDVAVGTSFIILSGGAAGLYEVSTHPDYGRKGIGTLMSLHALKWARDQGYHVSVLNSSEVAVPVYKRMGYELCGLLQTFIWENE
jgi:GNAT superfamily N-acetyltransferase